MSGLKATAGSPPAGPLRGAAGARGAAMAVLPVVPKTTKGFTGWATTNQGLYRLRHKQPRALPVEPESTKGAPVSISWSPRNGVVRGVCQQWHTRVPAWAFGSAGVRPVPREGCVVAGSSGALPRRCINPRPNCSALWWAELPALAICRLKGGNYRDFSTIEGGNYRDFSTIEGRNYRDFSAIERGN